MTEDQIKEKYAILTLQITKANFDAILKGEQKTETRLVFSNTAKRYFGEMPTVENYEDLRMWNYGLLKLINGRKKDAPTLYVKVVDTYYKYITDEKDEVIILEEPKGNMPALEVYYELGNVIFSKNIVP